MANVFNIFIMLAAIIGDIVDAGFEFNNYLITIFELFP